MKHFLNVTSLLISMLLIYSSPSYAFSSMTIHADSVTSNEVFTLGDINLKLNLSAIKQPVLSISAQLKMSSNITQDQEWASLVLACDIPSTPTVSTWYCHHGNISNTLIKLPFTLNISPNISTQTQALVLDFNMQNATFSDVAGLHAADKLNANVRINLEQKAEQLVWETQVNWLSGEVFWQPFYIANGGHTFQAFGHYQDHLITIEHANLALKNIGNVDVSGMFDINNYQIKALQASAPNINLEVAFPLLLQPLLTNTALNEAEVTGQAALNISVINNDIKAFALNLTNVDISDKASKFAFYKINAKIPWSFDDATQLQLSYASGQLLNLPLGLTSLQGTVNRYSVTSSQMTLPVLDGSLSLSDLSAARIMGQWYWHLRAKINPISMQDLSRALKLPAMVGQVSAEIPLVTYAAGNLTTDGALQFNLFSGDMTVSHLTMQTPLGKTPKLFADIQFKRLDLGDLTRTFSFGTIEGKLDGEVNNLELQNWKPVKFDAKLLSSPDYNIKTNSQEKYPKKISQRAVENISALGGAGAAAAIQRSFLRFFKQFNYAKLGLNCQLRNDICSMDGIESTPQGYVIVKGSGIPAITVMGYNKTVGWSELIGRIKRVTDGNAKATIQ